MKHSTKNILLFTGLLALLAIVGMSFGPSAPAAQYDAPSEYYTYAPSQDTITNTEADTLTLPVALLSTWSASYSVNLTQLSGTANVAVVLQKSNTANGTDWKTLDTFTGTSGLLHEEYSELLGRRYRLILTGTGTQSTTYDIDAILKKKY